MNELSKQRTDVTQSFEDFERIMEDYFQVIPPDIDFFKLDDVLHWDYDDLEQAVTFFFEDDWYLQAFIDNVEECPAKNSFFEFDEFDCVDREKLTVKIIGKIGGLYG